MARVVSSSGSETFNSSSPTTIFSRAKESGSDSGTETEYSDSESESESESDSENGRHGLVLVQTCRDTVVPDHLAEHLTVDEDDHTQTRGLDPDPGPIQDIEEPLTRVDTQDAGRNREKYPPILVNGPTLATGPVPVPARVQGASLDLHPQAIITDMHQPPINDGQIQTSCSSIACKTCKSAERIQSMKQQDHTDISLLTKGRGGLGRWRMMIATASLKSLMSNQLLAVDVVVVAVAG
ncbi:hypothetical protein QBC32DRAFT_210216 [Pseudoneurospora amorphoporcata]|uniref:Uncharacterized protein n=1 Tax=Pseudoneurospora amorphoporcata TaxID=241081 RepID=A0AAN6SH85_9PEZI|nr:hypothetical protein QBC32DRAFT_210216 [Pseudoneurospora amorphoporcata]